MLKGHTFNLQTFTSEAFAIFIDKFLNSSSGVARGCSLSNTNNSVTIGDGYFVIRGRLLQIISGVTISNITNNGFYSLVCEIDLSKTNTTDTLNQAEIKTLYNANTYPILTQQDITGSGTVFQYEFARFKVEGGIITNFADKRTYVDYRTLLSVIQDALNNVLDESIYLLKSNIKLLTGRINFIHLGQNRKYGSSHLEYPTGFTKDNTLVISAMTTSLTSSSDATYASGEVIPTSSGFGVNPKVILHNAQIEVCGYGTGAEDSISFKVLLMRLDGIDNNDS